MGTDSAPGQQKTFVVTHPTDPRSPMTVTQAQWREQKLGQQGWSKPEDAPDEPDEPEPVT